MYLTFIYFNNFYSYFITNVICRRANEVESNLEELQKVVFSVTKVKDKEHDIEKTKTKIQDIHR